MIVNHYKWACLSLNLKAECWPIPYGRRSSSFSSWLLNNSRLECIQGKPWYMSGGDWDYSRSERNVERGNRKAPRKKCKSRVVGGGRFRLKICPCSIGYCSTPILPTLALLLSLGLHICILCLNSVCGIRYEHTHTQSSVGRGNEVLLARYTYVSDSLAHVRRKCSDPSGVSQKAEPRWSFRPPHPEPAGEGFRDARGGKEWNMMLLNMYY